MNIEPCPFCGEECIPTGGGYLKCLNIRCPYHVPAEQLEQHNRLSRIVRAAEAWAMLKAQPLNDDERYFRDELGFDFSKLGDKGKALKAAEEALLNAVEGGRADG